MAKTFRGTSGSKFIQDSPLASEYPVFSCHNTVAKICLKLAAALKKKDRLSVMLDEYMSSKNTRLLVNVHSRKLLRNQGLMMLGQQRVRCSPVPV